MKVLNLKNLSFAAAFSLHFLFVAIASVNAQSGAKEASGSDAKPMNVLFLISDDLRPELGCYGVKEIQSPNVDRLAGRGLLFQRAYCQQAVCSPSRTSVMTGMRPDSTKVHNLTTHFREALPSVVTLPQLFKQNGYVSRGYGKIYHGEKLDDAHSWTAGVQPSHSGSARQHVMRQSTAARFVSVSEVVGKKQKQEKVEQELEEIPLTKTDRGLPFKVTDDPVNSGSDGRTADQAISALQEFKKDGEPFFLAVGFRKPHLPFSIPAHYWDLYDQDKIPMADNRFLPTGAPDFSMVPQNEMWNYSGVPDTADLPDGFARKLKHGYYAAVSYMDAQLGRVLDELDRLELADNTIVVLWGDQGWKLGEHNRWCKHSNVEDDTRAPLIISVPGMGSSGQSTSAIVEFLDIYPTVAELAGLSAPDTAQGKSLVPLVKDPGQPWDHVAISQYPRKVEREKLMGYSMRTDRYRLTKWVARDDLAKVVAVELYDHQTDPQENTNVADDPEKSEVLQKLSSQWEEKVTSILDEADQAVANSASKEQATGFAHPGVAHSAEDIAFVKQKIKSKQQPWYDALQWIKRSRRASLDYEPSPREHVERGPYNNPNIGSSEFTDDGKAAYVHALLWAIEGDEAHARKAAEIIDAWSETLETIGNHDAKLLVGMSGYQYCVAAELLKHTWDGWSADKQSRFEKMIREKWYPLVKNFYPTANGNWDASMMQVIIAMGVFLDDREMVDRVVDYFREGKGNGAIGNYFNEFGQCQESGRDQSHTQMGLEFLSNTCQIAWIQGIDLYGAKNNRLQLGFEYTAKYNLGDDVPYERFRSYQDRYDYLEISDDSRGRLRPMYEKILRHYQDRQGIESPYTEQAVVNLRAGRDRVRREGRNRERDRESGENRATEQDRDGARASDRNPDGESDRDVDRDRDRERSRRRRGRSRDRSTNYIDILMFAAAEEVDSETEVPAVNK